MRYISLFAGIGCADVAWASLGWEPLAFAEIDPFASAILAARFSHVPNVGDVTAHDWSQYRGKCDLVIGGSPCQAFSIAGLKQSLDDPRGQLTLAFVEACNAIDPPWTVWENVPNVLACAKDNPFGCLVAGMVGASEPIDPGTRNGRWPDAGMVVGPQRAAVYGILDSQHFGVPQRRRRVFLVAVALSHPSFAPGATPNPAAIFPLPAGGLGHPSEGGQTGQAVVAAAGRGAAKGGEVGGGSAWPVEISPTVVAGAPFSRTGNSRIECDAIVPAVTAKWAKGCGGPAGDETQNLVAVPLVGDGEVAGTLTQRLGSGGPDDNDAQREMYVVSKLAVPVEISPSGDKEVTVAPTLTTSAWKGPRQYNVGAAVVHGVVRDPAVSEVNPVEDAVPLDLRNATRDTRPDGHTPGGGLSAKEGDPAFTVTAAGAVQAVAFSSKDDGGDEGDVSPTLRAMGHSGSHPNGGGQIAVALRMEESSDSVDLPVATTGSGTVDVSPTIRAQTGTLRPEKATDAVVVDSLAVRRLAPRECERLMGLPDDWTLIPYGKARKQKDLAEMAEYWGVSPEVAKTLAADSLRYKAIGNGMAVPVVWWIGMRIRWVMERLASWTGRKEGDGV